MKSKKKFLFFCAIFFVFQFAQIFWPVFPSVKLWPFCPYDMFAFPGDYNLTQIKVVLKDKNNHNTEVFPGNTIPIEFFRANTIYMKIYGCGSDTMLTKWFGTGEVETTKQLFSKSILKRLNSKPWKKYDEIFESAQSETPFKSMRVILSRTDFKKYEYGQQLKPYFEETLYEYTLIP